MNSARKLKSPVREVNGDPSSILLAFVSLNSRLHTFSDSQSVWSELDSQWMAYRTKLFHLGFTEHQLELAAQGKPVEMPRKFTAHVPKGKRTLIGSAVEARPRLGKGSRS